MSFFWNVIALNFVMLSARASVSNAMMLNATVQSDIMISAVRVSVTAQLFNFQAF